MLDKLWRRLVRPGVMRDADRLIAAHGRGAYGMARLGATAARESEGCGHWSSVADEIARRLAKDHGSIVPRSPRERPHPGDDRS